jgi:DNA-binding transcriptional LysR family regulator
MTNIPTELLRTFVAVVDMRSFTRAAQSLGITQPAVSAQVKRLQQLLGG